MAAPAEDEIRAAVARGRSTTDPLAILRQIVREAFEEAAASRAGRAAGERADGDGPSLRVIDGDRAPAARPERTEP